MVPHLLPTKFSVVAVLPSDWKAETGSLSLHDIRALLTIGVTRASRIHLFRDLKSGSVLYINTNSTFRLTDPDGYSSGLVLAQRMIFEGDNVIVWHQDKRLSFSCRASLQTGFCLGWLIDRSKSRSYRILDPGTAD